MFDSATDYSANENEFVYIRHLEGDAGVEEDEDVNPQQLLQKILPRAVSATDNKISLP